MLFKKLKCWFLGHKKYNPKSLRNEDFMVLRDDLGQKLITVNICARCGSLYTNFSV
jgi:hypothetical protein